MQGMYEGGFPSGFKPEVPKYTGKEGDFERFRQSFITYARHLRLDWVFTGDCELIHVGDPSVVIEELEAQYGRDVVSTNVRVWHLLSASLTEEVDQDILFRVHSPREAWDTLVETRSPKTQGARLALLSKIDNVTIAVDKDPIVQLVELESTARRLRCYEEFKHLNDSLILSKFLNALLPEYEVQRQMLEGVKGPLRREEVVSVVRGRFESSAFQKLLEKGSASNGALVARGRLGKASGSRRGGRARGQRQDGDDGRGEGGPGGDDSDDTRSTASSSSSDDPPRWRCHVCRKIVAHRARECPHRRCFRCGKKGHSAEKCKDEDDAKLAEEDIALVMNGVDEDDSSVCSDADAEAF
ncbi:unnamed protein product [Sphacelaria rigidula]